MVYISMLTSMLHSSVLVYYVLVVCWCIYMYQLPVVVVLVVFPVMYLMVLVMVLLMLCISPAVGMYLTSCPRHRTHVLLLRSYVLSPYS